MKILRYTFDDSVFIEDNNIVFRSDKNLPFIDEIAINIKDWERVKAFIDKEIELTKKA